MEIRHLRDKPSLNFDNSIPVGDEKEIEEKSINNKLHMSSQFHFILGEANQRAQFAKLN